MQHHFHWACFAIWAWIGISLAARATALHFDWTAITPSSKLLYHPCYDELRCARLAVPRDWLDTSNEKTVALAVISLPATVGPDDPSFGGSIITNPGGPGGSGVDFLRGNGRLLQNMTDGKKHYEILSFDPRGVGSTTPRVDCFGRSHLFARDAWLLESRGVGGLDSSESGLKRSLALYDGFGDLCEATDQGEDILAYVSTASVARDIVEIADRVEEQRQPRNPDALQDPAQRPMDAGFNDRKDGKTPPRILYWGFSYGTILGNTLASMFPGRMGRVILDGVVDIHDYMGGKWLRNLLDTEKIIDYFYETCFEAGDSCPLWKDDDRSGKDIKDRVDELISARDSSPVALIPDDKSLNVRIITGLDVRNSFKLPVYQPLPALFEQLARTLAEALEGNYSSIGADLFDGTRMPRLEDACGIANSTARTPGDAQVAILCGDARHEDTTDAFVEGHGTGDISHWQHYIEELKKQSPTIGPWWSSIASSCSGWRVTPKWVFTGPWKTPPADPSLTENTPSAPILL